MWKFVEVATSDDMNDMPTEAVRRWRSPVTSEGAAGVVRMYRTEYARWDDPDAAEPDQLGTIGVAWELVEKDCECDECCEDCCPSGHESIAEALGGVLEDWDVRPDSLWEASCFPVPWGDDAEMAKVWVSAHEKYQYEQDTRYDYSLHVEGVTPEVRREVFAAVGVK